MISAIRYAEKFKEVFGYEVAIDCYSFEFDCNDIPNCDQCPLNNFWDKEYEEPAKTN